MGTLRNYESVFKCSRSTPLRKRWVPARTGWISTCRVCNAVQNPLVWALRPAHLAEHLDPVVRKEYYILTESSKAPKFVRRIAPNKVVVRYFLDGSDPIPVFACAVKAVMSVKVTISVEPSNGKQKALLEEKLDTSRFPDFETWFYTDTQQLSGLAYSHRSGPDGGGHDPFDLCLGLRYDPVFQTYSFDLP